MDDGLENLLDASAFLGARENRAGIIETDNFANLTPCFVWLRARQVDLVDDGNDFEVVVGGQVGVGQRLGLDAL